MDQLPVARIEGVRFIRLVGIVDMPSAHAKIEAELTKPLRLLELYESLRGTRAVEGRAGPRKAQGGALSGRVLVVEDQPLGREVAHGMLTALGLRVETANDGQQALARLERERFDVVLMDCEMPVMDGLAAVTALRQ